MDRRYIDDQHVVARYLANRLTDEEREAFEAYYLEHPDMGQEMEAAIRFKVGLMRLRETGELAPLVQRGAYPICDTWPRQPRSRRSRWVRFCSSIARRTRSRSSLPASKRCTRRAAICR